MKSNIVVIAGQTASGKSELALQLAKKYSGIVINGDSRQIYSDFNISTAKPIPDSIKKDGTWYIDDVPHYLYGFASLETEYNIHKYQSDVKKIIEKNRDKLILIVGGSGLYIDSIIYGYNLPNYNESSINDSKETVDLENLNTYSIEKLQTIAGEMINELNESDRNNPRRLISIIKKNVLSQNEVGNKKERNSLKGITYLYLLLEIDNEILEKRIKDRVDTMLERGLEAEAREIYNKYNDSQLPSLNTIGYKEFIPYFKGEISLEETVELIKIHSRQYAKRQRTWFKRNSKITKISDFKEADYAVSNFLRNV